MSSSGPRVCRPWANRAAERAWAGSETTSNGTLATEADMMAASRRPDKHPFDASVIADGTLVLIEMLTATLRLATLKSCDPALYRRDLKRDFEKEAGQLSSD